MTTVATPLFIQSTTNGLVAGFVNIPFPQNDNNLTLDAFFDVGAEVSINPSLPALFHIRQIDGTDHGLLDQFSTQLISYEDVVGPQGKHTVRLRVRVRRIDQDSGWDQSLRMDVLLKLNG